tara:strand:+ start:188 stop:445 length:258 start_codon:yes stop_codon:yes gene_type:complete
MVQITARYIDELKLLPRLAFLCQIILTWKVCLWFMTLEDPTTQQSAFVSLVTAMLSASFALWLGKEASTNRVSKQSTGEENDRVS